MRFWRGSRRPSWIEDLRSIWLLSACTDDELRLVDSLCTGVEVPEGKLLVERGAPSTAFFLSVRGTAVVAVDGRPAALVEAGSFFGEAALFGPGRARADTSVTAVTRMELLVFSRQEGERLRRAPLPSVRAKIEATIAERARAVEALAGRPPGAGALASLTALPAPRRASA